MYESNVDVMNTAVDLVGSEVFHPHGTMSDDELSFYVAYFPYQSLGFVCPSYPSGWSFPGVLYLTSESLGLQLGEDM